MRPERACALDMAVRTLTMGYTIKMDDDVSKLELVNICRELALMFGEGHEFRPLKGKGLLNWTRWPGKVDGVGISSKEMRLMAHTAEANQTVSWPDVPDNVMELWDDDGSLGIRRGRYRTQLAAYGDAPTWTREELEVIREVFMTHGGWRVSRVVSLRGLGNRVWKVQRRDPKDSRYFPQARGKGPGRKKRDDLV